MPSQLLGSCRIRPTSTNKGNTDTNGGCNTVSVSSTHKVGWSESKEEVLKELTLNLHYSVIFSSTLKLSFHKKKKKFIMFLLINEKKTQKIRRKRNLLS